MSRMRAACVTFPPVFLRTAAMSIVTLLPPIGRTLVWNGEPSENRARSIVPAPISATPTPRSFSVSVRTASAEASEPRPIMVFFERTCSPTPTTMTSTMSRSAVGSMVPPNRLSGLDDSGAGTALGCEPQIRSTMPSMATATPTSERWNCRMRPRW